MYLLTPNYGRDAKGSMCLSLGVLPTPAGFHKVGEPTSAFITPGGAHTTAVQVCYLRKVEVHKTFGAYRSPLVFNTALKARALIESDRTTGDPIRVQLTDLCNPVFEQFWKHVPEIVRGDYNDRRED